MLLSVTPGPDANAPGSDILPRPGELNRSRPAPTRIQAKDVDGIAGSSLLASCAVTRDQLHRHAAMGPCGMHDGRSIGATAIREDPVRGQMSTASSATAE